MTYVETKEEALKGKIIPQTKREDFESFWQKAVADMRAVPLQVRREPVDTPYSKTVTTYKVYFNTHDQTEVVAYFSHPAGATEKLPCVAHFHGGSLQKEMGLSIVATGVCCFSIDVRSQGGETVDKANYSTDFNGGLMTLGVLDKNEFYMKNIYLDAVRAMDVIATLPEVDPTRIVTYGGSQGGALSITASALSGKSIKCYTNETSYCCIHRRVELGSRIFATTKEFLKNYPHHTDAVMETVSYFDVNNMVSLLKVPTAFCLGLADDVCLPEFVYSAYTHAECEKTLMIVPFTPHTTPKPFTEFMHREFSEL
ncbi:MAG: acetylxylan esterase [Clostridia bacterium]|nr:acetylxylan esterase [Clostridia bacterium]